MGLLVAGIQPGYLPWLGFFDQMRRADVFILADEMPFSTDGWTHRNRVRGPSGAHWLSVPTEHESRTSIRDVRVADDQPWRRKHVSTLRHFYTGPAHAREVLDAVEETLTAGGERLVEVSIPLIVRLAGLLGIDTPVVVSSQAGLEARFRERFGATAGATERVIAYVEAVGGDRLLEGETGAAYLDTNMCSEHGVNVEFHRYSHPQWPQRHEGFLSHLSTVDLLLCVGPSEAARVLGSVS